MLNEIEERLKRITYNNNQLFQYVSTAIDASAVIQNGKVLKDSAFIIEANEESNGDNDLTMVHSQDVTYSFAVIIGVRALNDRLGKNMQQRLKVLRDQTRQALRGWTPDQSIYDPVNFVRGETLEFSDGGLFWMEEYSTVYELRSALK